MAILNECNSISESLELSKVIKEVSHIDQYDYLLEDFGSFNLVKQNLKKEINIQYDSRRILLLKSMLAFLEGLPAYTHNECFSTYGTNSLNLVLEKVIKKCFF